MLTDDATIFLVREALWVAIKIAAPLLGAGVLIGLVISVLQSITSIQDQTLTLVPKIVAMVVVAAILVPWIVERLLTFAGELFTLA